MNYAVVYYSRSGNTKKLADAAAEVLGVSAQDVTTDLTGKADRVFLASSLYAGGYDPSVAEFVKRNADKIGEIVCIGSSASGKSTAKKVKVLADGLNIPVYKRSFNCPGHFLFMHKNRPDGDDLAQLKDFVKSIIEEA